VNEAPGGENVKEIGLVSAHYRTTGLDAARGAAGVTGPGVIQPRTPSWVRSVLITKKAAIACDGGFHFSAEKPRSAYFAVACFSGSLTAWNVANSTARAGHPLSFPLADIDILDDVAGLGSIEIGRADSPSSCLS